MDPRRFDDLTRGLAKRPSRRATLRAVAGGTLGALLALKGRSDRVDAQEAASPEAAEHLAILDKAREIAMIRAGLMEEPVVEITCRVPLEKCSKDDVCCTGSCRGGRCQCLANGKPCQSDGQCCTYKCDIPITSLVGTCRNRG